MKAPIRLLAPALAASVAACAALSPERPPEQNAELRLDRGISAVEAGFYSEGFDDLAWVYTRCTGREAGVRALTALAAIELDPRNPAARPPLGMELLGQVLQDSTAPRWIRPLVETSFLAALALGAPHPLERAEQAESDPLEEEHAAHDADLQEPGGHEHPALEAERSSTGTAGPVLMEAVHGCGPVLDPTRRVAADLPTLPGPSMAELLASAADRRAAAVARSDTLQAELSSVKAQLQATREELERIRKTLKP